MAVISVLAVMVRGPGPSGEQGDLAEKVSRSELGERYVATGLGASEDFDRATDNQKQARSRLALGDDDVALVIRSKFGGGDDLDERLTLE